MDPYTHSLGHLMLDIETLGVSPGCAVLRISAVEFDLETGKTGRKFDSGISLESSLAVGLKIEASTLKWWLTQDEKVRELAFNSSYDLSEVLSLFNGFLLPLGPSVCVWGNGVRFDVGILEGLYKAVCLKMPITGRQERDVRTLVSFRPDIKTNMPFDGDPHVALDDCKHQIKYCSTIWKNINAVTVTDDRFLSK